jgi:hypothetical protein
LTWQGLLQILGVSRDGRRRSKSSVTSDRDEAELRRADLEARLNDLSLRKIERNKPDEVAGNQNSGVDATTSPETPSALS